MAFVHCPLYFRGTKADEWCRARPKFNRNHRTRAQLQHELSHNYHQGSGKFHAVFDSSSTHHSLQLDEHDIGNVDNNCLSLDNNVVEDDEIEFPAYLPQTMERALLDAQSALMRALAEDQHRLIIELPMGRTRKYWSTLSPVSEWYKETEILVSHFLQPYGSADLRVVYSDVCGNNCADAPFISQRHELGEVDPHELIDAAHDETLIVFVGIPDRESSRLVELLAKIPRTMRVVLFNCRLGGSLIYEPRYTVAYSARTSRHTAIARYQYDGPWHYFVEIAPFEYYWVYDESCDASDPFVPDVDSVLDAAQACGCRLAPNSVFYAPHKQGCEAGFWPFQTLVAKYLLPLHGDTYQEVIDRSQKKRKPNTPFGFF